jgi:hypothetical protein
VGNLKSGYRAQGDTVSEPTPKLTATEADLALEELLDTLPPIPSLSDKALSREAIYAPEDDTR